MFLLRFLLRYQARFHGVNYAIASSLHGRFEIAVKSPRNRSKIAAKIAAKIASVNGPLGRRTAV